MKKLITVILAAVLVFSLSSTAMAYDVPQISDDTGLISSEGQESLNEKAYEIYQTYGYRVCFLMVNYPGDVGTVAYAENTYDYNFGTENGMLLLLTDDEWYLYLSGEAETYFDGKDDEIWAYALNGSTYEDFVRLYLEKVNMLLRDAYPDKAPQQSTQFYTDAQIPDERLLPRLVDSADLLTSSEEKELLSLLDEISERQQLDVVVITTDSLEGYSAMAYADDIYDYCGYGFGESRDGVLLLVSMADRDWWMSTCGYGITVFTDAGIDELSGKFLPYLSDGDYFKAFKIYAEQCDSYITQAKTGSPYDTGNLPKAPFNALKAAGISVVAGLVIGLIVVLIMLGQLKSVHMKGSASDYTCPGSLMISDRRDYFRTKHVSKVKRPEPSRSSGGGGSSTHTSSSGTTHGGGGGKF